MNFRALDAVILVYRQNALWKPQFTRNAYSSNIAFSGTASIKPHTDEQVFLDKFSLTSFP